MADLSSRPLDIPALTIRQPWASMIADVYVRVANLAWETDYTGLIAIHAAANSGSPGDQAHGIHTAARLSGLPPAVVERSMEVRGAVVAVACLTGVCSLSLDLLPGETLACDCGPWASPGQRHFRITNVRALPEPVPCKGAQRLWRLPDDVYDAVLPTLTGGAS